MSAAVWTLGRALRQRSSVRSRFPSVPPGGRARITAMPCPTAPRARAPEDDRALTLRNTNPRSADGRHTPSAGCADEATASAQICPPPVRAKPRVAAGAWRKSYPCVIEPKWPARRRRSCMDTRSLSRQAFDLRSTIMDDPSNLRRSSCALTHGWTGVRVTCEPRPQAARYLKHPCLHTATCSMRDETIHVVPTCDIDSCRIWGDPRFGLRSHVSDPLGGSPIWVAGRCAQRPFGRLTLGMCAANCPDTYMP